jgi:hypothetical protein
MLYFAVWYWALNTLGSPVSPASSLGVEGYDVSVGVPKSLLPAAVDAL